MLNIHQLSDAISQVRADHASIEHFERWLRIESRNVHSSGDEAVINAVLCVEAVLSAYRFDGIEPEIVQKELANAIAPFCHMVVVKMETSPVDKNDLALAGLRIERLDYGGQAFFLLLPKTLSSVEAKKKPAGSSLSPYSENQTTFERVVAITAQA